MIELVIPGNRLTPRGVVAAARGYGYLLPPYSLTVCRFVDAHGLPYPPANQVLDLKAAIDGLTLGGLVVDAIGITHVDLRVNHTDTEPRTQLRLTSHRTREDRP